MKSVLNKKSFEDLLTKLKKSSRLLLFINYDKVLADLSKQGVPLSLSLKLRKQLRELSEKDGLHLILISNHSMKTLKKIVGFSGIYLIANRGLEILGPDVSVVHSEAKNQRKSLKKIAEKITQKNKKFPGIKLEDRGLSLVMNFSEANLQTQTKARAWCEELWTTIMDKITIQEERNQLIMYPRVGWNNTRAVMFLCNKFTSPRRRPFIITIGADKNDEEIFDFVDKEGIVISVTNEKKIPNSKANYYLKNREEVKQFISNLQEKVSSIYSRYKKTL